MLLILALGMTLIVATGGIDLSVGIALDFGAAFAIVAMTEYDAGWMTAVCAGVAGGSLVGIMNAILVVGLRVSPFMATIGTFFIGSSVQRIFTNGGGPISHRRMPDGFREIAMGDVMGIPLEVIIAATLALVYFVVLEMSIWGPAGACNGHAAPCGDCRGYSGQSHSDRRVYRCGRHMRRGRVDRRGLHSHVHTAGVVFLPA